MSQIVIWYKKDDVTKKNRLSHVTSCLEIVLSFPRMVENGGTGASSTGKSLLEALHEAGGGKEAWETQNKITERDAGYGKGMSWSEVFARNSLFIMNR